jgi:hypothetical protein
VPWSLYEDRHGNDEPTSTVSSDEKMVPFVGQPKSRDDPDGYGRLPLDGIELCTLNLW